MAASRKSILIVAVPLWIFFLIVYSSADKAPYTSFAKNAASAPLIGYYDYVIIGGGTAGCPLAATLSASAKVLLLERGGLPYDNPDVVHIAGFVKLLTDPSPYSAAQLFISTDGVFNHRARVLGGGSAINAGFYTRASRDYVNQVGWDPRLVNESYEWVERKVAFRPRLRQWQAAVREGLLDAGVLPDNGFTYEHLHGTKIGGTIFDEDGVRHTAADLLEYAQPNNITVYLHAAVHQILFTTSPGQRPKANGVLFKDSNGRKHRAYLNSGGASEIIVSAGAMGSPQLLMLSGIGPGQELRARGINVVMEQAFVGQGMSDNPMNALLIPSIRPVEISLVQVVGISDVGSYIEAASGLLNSSSIFDYVNVANTVSPVIHSFNFSIPTNQSIQDMDASSGGVGVVLQKIMGPLSSGYLELESKDPNRNPRVTFNYFKDERDVARCVGGMEILRKVVQSGALSEFLKPSTSFESLQKLMLSLPINLRWKHVAATYSMEQYCRDTVMTLWHYHGGCQVGRVVDRDYRVIGVHSLRVIDGSTFYFSPGTNPQATLMMLGRYMGQKILQQRNPQTEN
ncbi:protein HOTHEAD-like [Salvia miltiorrhiza]|uniref:protein HOTHEAD-like n=1 Tax=Salvia miltiorrhiza TaxID=226208 RepID=UPI0025ABC7A9|nr:protein HOTHEAD-like [Salvia miltiorrhiza]